MCNYGMNILQHPIFYGEYLLYEIIAFHPLPHRRYPITISLYPIGANTPRHTMRYLLLLYDPCAFGWV
jgi:hypothetical protein